MVSEGFAWGDLRSWPRLMTGVSGFPRGLVGGSPRKLCSARLMISSSPGARDNCLPGTVLTLQKRVCASEGGVAADAAVVLDLPLGAHSLSPAAPIATCLCTQSKSFPRCHAAPPHRGHGGLWRPAVSFACSPRKGLSSVVSVCLDPGLGTDADCPGPWGPLEAGRARVQSPGW